MSTQPHQPRKPSGHGSMNDSLTCDAFVVNATDSAAVAQAQASIDRHPANSNLDSEDDDPCDKPDLARIAAALELIGKIGVGPLTADNNSATEPITLGRFQVLHERGQGGFGIVLRALDPVLQREVALKIPRPERLMAGQSPDDFIREAQVAARLDHPGIVRVYEIRRLGPIWYIASAYCEGPTLADWLSQRVGLLSTRLAAELVALIAEAVHYAHSRGVLHLDLKPENVLLELPAQAEDLPHPLVTDFGLSGRCDHLPNPGGPQRIAGTPYYMAPEQRAGDQARIGVATDIYALGAILYDLLRGTNGPLASDHNGQPDSATSNHLLRPPLHQVHADISAICQKSIQEVPEDRYASAADLAADLRHFLRGEAVTARQASWPERMLRWSRRRPAVAALCGLLVFTAVASLVTISYLWQRAEHNLSQLQSEQQGHQRTADKMRTSLLNLTWLAQESRLQPGQLSPAEQAQISLLRDFYTEIRTWGGDSQPQSHPDSTLLAASHSLALVDGLALIDDRDAQKEFDAGLAAWQAVIADDPGDARWPRALALHILTYAARFHHPEGDGWPQRERQSTAFTPDLATLIEQPYALLLVEFARRHAALRSSGTAYDMLRAAIPALEKQTTPSPQNEEHLRIMLMAYSTLSQAAKSLGKNEEFQAALERAHTYANLAPPPNIAPPLLALAVGDTFRIRAAEMARNGRLKEAVKLFEQARPFFERAVTAEPDDPVHYLSLTGIQRHSAELQSRLGNWQAAAADYRIAIAVTDAGMSHAPAHRELLRRRATLKSSLARCLLDNQREREAQPILESAVQDYAALELRKVDSRNLWMQAIRNWQTLGRLYANQQRIDKAMAAYQESLQLLEGIRSRHGDSPQFKEYFDLSRSEFARLMPQPAPDAPSNDH